MAGVDDGNSQHSTSPSPETLDKPISSSNTPPTPPASTYTDLQSILDKIPPSLGISPRKAIRILRKHAKPDDSSVLRTRKRSRRQRYDDDSDEENIPQTPAQHESSGGEESRGSLIEGTQEYKELMLECRLHFALHFALVFEKEINALLIKVLGPAIVKKESADSYDQAYEKVKRWGRQWQHEVLTALTKHVHGIQEHHSELEIMDESQIREFFHHNMNIYSLKIVFHVLAADVDLDKIFNSRLCQLYCTMYTNMCFYVWQTRVRNKGGIRQEDEKALFEKFRLLAREPTFSTLKTSDIPRPPPKPVAKKRTKFGQLTPLSSTDNQFRFFGLPPAAQGHFMPEQTLANQTQIQTQIHAPTTQYPRENHNQNGHNQGMNNLHQGGQSQATSAYSQGIPSHRQQYQPNYEDGTQPEEIEPQRPYGDYSQTQDNNNAFLTQNSQMRPYSHTQFNSSMLPTQNSQPRGHQESHGNHPSSHMRKNPYYNSTQASAGSGYVSSGTLMPPPPMSSSSIGGGYVPGGQNYGVPPASTSAPVS